MHVSGVETRIQHTPFLPTKATVAGADPAVLASVVEFLYTGHALPRRPRELLSLCRTLGVERLLTLCELALAKEVCLDRAELLINNPLPRPDLARWFSEPITPV